jgi:hypothetical protein
MEYDDTTVNWERESLSGRTERVGFATGMGVGGAVMFGGVFVAAGVAIMLVGLKVIPVDPSGVHAPYWVLTVFGLVFAGAGSAVWGMAVRAWRAKQRCAELALQFRDTPEIADYPWDTKGVTRSPWGGVLKGIVGVSFVCIFMSIFNWWAWFSGDGIIFVQVIVSLFDLIILFVVIQVGHATLAALKFGGSGVRYTAFPYRTGSTVELKWYGPKGLDTANSTTFTLRAAEEWYEITGSGEHRSKQLRHAQTWAMTHRIDGPLSCSLQRPMQLAFDVPMEAPGTDFGGDESVLVFWELEVNVDAPGLDFEGRYVVPIYGQPADE